MNFRFFIILALISTLSSCCWLVHDDCAVEEGTLYEFPVVVNYQDSVIGTGDLLPITIETVAFAAGFDEENYDYFNFGINIVWFDGNFISDANSRVDIVNSNIPTLELNEYQSYSGELPENDISFDLSFPIEGYYMIEFYGSTSSTAAPKRKRRCVSCGSYAYYDFTFISSLSNEVYFPIYEQSGDYSYPYAQLQRMGAIFIKVE